MNTRNKLIYLFLFMILGSSLFAQSGNFRFDLDLQMLNSLSRSELMDIAEKKELLVLDGLLSSIYHGPDNIVLTIVNGQWKGTESIDMYSCEVILDKESWLGVFPERRPRDPGEEVLFVNTYVLILGTLQDVKTINNENIIQMSGLQIRDISN